MEGASRTGIALQWNTTGPIGTKAVVFWRGRRGGASVRKGNVPASPGRHSQNLMELAALNLKPRCAGTGPRQGTSGTTTLSAITS
jgi:hypothetical protein